MCTTNEVDDDILVDIADRNGINYFRGSTDDKLDRWLNAAEKFDVDYIVTVDGDYLFCEPKLVDLAFEQFEKSNPDFIQAQGIICGAFTYGIKTSALKKVCEIKDSDQTEMMWVYFTDTGLFNVEELQGVPQRYYRDDIRMTMDYKEDLDFFIDVLRLLGKSVEYVTLDEILQIIDKNPHINKINYFRQKEFIANQDAKTNLKIKDNVK